MKDFRWDGSMDCPDQSDEFKCDILIIDNNYNNELIAGPEKHKIDLAIDLTVTDIITIDGVNNLFRPSFELDLNWQDQRLRQIIYSVA